jgi:hypothetical protein
MADAAVGDHVCGFINAAASLLEAGPSILGNGPAFTNPANLRADLDSLPNGRKGCS